MHEGVNLIGNPVVLEKYGEHGSGYPQYPSTLSPLGQCDSRRRNLNKVGGAVTKVG